MADGNKNNALADSELLARIAGALERLAPAALTGTLPAGEAARLKCSHELRDGAAQPL